MAELDQSTGGGDDLRRRLFWERVLLALLFVGTFVVRLWGLGKMHVWDENVYLQNAELICCGKNNYNEIDSRPPLLSLLFAAVFLVWHNDYAPYVLTAFLNALGPVFLYLAGRMFVGRVPAAIAALLLAFTPFLVSVFPPASTGFVSDFTGHSLMSDCPALTLILLAFWLLLRALEKETDLRFACAGFVLAMTVLMRFPSLSSVGMLSLLVFAARRWFRAALAVSAGFVVGVAPYLCWSRYKYGGFLATFFSGWDNYDGPGDSFFYYFKYSGIIFSWLAIAGLALWIGQWIWQARKQTEAQPLVTFAGALGQRLWSKEGYLWLWGLVLMVFFSKLKHKEPRYVIPAAPPLFLLAGIGLSVLLKGRRKFVRIGGTAVLAAVLCYSFWPVRERFADGFIDHEVSDEMVVSEYLNRNAAPSTVLYANSSYPDFAYYTKLNVQVLPEGGPPLYEALGQLPRDGIMVAYKKYDNDATPEPSLSWLDANPHFHRLQEFPRIVLYEYHSNAVK